MRFRRAPRDEPEINLIPFIDVLLVVLIFLMLSSCYGKLTELQVKLLEAQSEPHRDRQREIPVAVRSGGPYSVNSTAVKVTGVGALIEALTGALTQASQPHSVLIIRADAQAAHPAVMNVLEAARRGGLAQITFAAQRGRPLIGART